MARVSGWAVRGLAIAFGLALLPDVGQALTIAASGTNPTTGNAISAQVTFAISGTDLIVTLTNTSTLDVAMPSDVLTAVFFNVAGDPSLTRTSAVVATGSSVISSDGSQSGGAGTDVGGEWAYRNGLSQYGDNTGISSAGFGIFGVAQGSFNFPGANLQGPANGDVNGVEYGVTSASDVASTVNAGLAGKGLIQNSVVFTLGGFYGTLDDISNVKFQYGTGLTDAVIPEPGTVLLMGVGLLGLAWHRRRS
jgi:hypothetical protein